MKHMNSRELARAFAEGIPFDKLYKCHNATASQYHYRLHGHLIVEKMSPYHVQIDPCGYYTATTQRHINNILKALGYHKTLPRMEISKNVVRYRGKIKDVFQVQQWPLNMDEMRTTKENFEQAGWKATGTWIESSTLTMMEVLRKLCYNIHQTNARLGECLYSDLWRAQEQEEIPAEFNWNYRKAEGKAILLAYKEEAYAL